MGSRHLTHRHDLSFYQEGEKKFRKTSCDGCGEVISGPAYYCDTCERFILHESCFGFPREVKSPLHHSADHPLILLPLTSDGFICNGCRNLSVGFVYNCRQCEFNLDVDCAFQNENGKSKRPSDDQSENLVTEIEHFLDSHKLFLFYCKKQDEKRCLACKLQLSSEACYGCLKCYFLLHRSCLEVAESIRHPYHPHSLIATSQFLFDICRACKTAETSLRYRCFGDSFDLHLLCAKNSMEHTPPLQHKCHRSHDLYCFVPHDSIGSNGRCNLCDELCESAFYTCFDCDFSVHLGCIPIPPKVDYQWHSHPLTLKDSFCEDESGVYCCYACGESRNPNFPVYWCEECPEEAPYVAHVECIVSEEDDFCRSSWHTSDRKAVNEGLQLEPVKEEEGDSKEQINQLQSYWHDHPLILKAKEGAEIIPCDMCEREIEGDMYFCETCTGVYFHPSCAGLPGEITSPLHIHSLYADFRGSKHFMCGLCKNVTNGYRYKSPRCSFSLEVKCAILTNDQYQDWKEKHPEVRIRHFSHTHELIQVKHTSDVKLFCNLCRFPLSGSTYCCLDCAFFIHESCSEAKQQMQPLYHLPHRLSAQYLNEYKDCGVCGLLISEIGYSCDECPFFVHFKCGTCLTSPLMHKFHEHTLFSFSASDIWVFDLDRDDSFGCCKCFHKFRGSFYRCLECNLAVHPECIPLPKMVKHSCHSDPLTLMSSMCEDDSGVYYCDVCQKPRNPNHPVYWCQECHSLECPFVAHVGCVIQEGDASLEVISWKDSGPKITGDGINSRWLRPRGINNIWVRSRGINSIWVRSRGINNR